MPAFEYEYEIGIVNNNIDKLNTKNSSLTKKLSKLQNKDSAARGELKQQNYLYRQLFTQNSVLLCIIIASGAYYYKQRTK